MNIAFIACAEKGYLEDQVVLLCRSIRRFTGRYASSSIYTFQPREGMEISHDTLNLLKGMNVNHITEPINRLYPNYPIGNKIFVCAWAEKNLTEDVLVFLDSDTMFCNEPEAFDLSDNTIVAIRPVDKKGRGSRGEDDMNDSYWQTLYELCGIQDRPFIRTTIDQDYIRAYFNAGLIVCRRSSGIFQRWKRFFLTLMEASHIPTKAAKKELVLNNMDQLSLSASISDRMDSVKILDERYNYPLPLRSINKSDMSTAQLSSLIHIHYHRWFRKPNFLRLLQPPLDPSDEIFSWIESYLPLNPVIHDSLDFRGLEG